MNKRKNGGKLFDRYFMNYFTSTIIPFIILFTVIIAIGVIYIVNYEKNLTADARRQSANLIDSELNTATNIYASLCSNTSAEKFFYGDFSTYDAFERADTLKQINSYISIFLLSNRSIESIGIYSPKNEIFVLNNANIKYSDFKNDAWYENFMNNSKQHNFWSEYSKSQNNIPVISLYNVISSGELRSGLIIININLNELNQEYNRIVNSDKYGIILANDDNVLFSSYENDGAADISKLKEQAITAPSPWGVFAVINTYSNKLPFTLATYILCIFTVIFIVLVFIIRISYNLAKNSYIPIEDTLKFIQSFGTDSTPEVISSYDEINLIFENLYNQKAEHTTLKMQFEQAVMQINNLRETVLEAQIKPHFLFNTLEIINLEAYDLFGGNNVVSKMIVALSKLLKLSFKTMGKFIKISDELNHVKQYIYLQSIKYENCFKTEWDIDESILNYSTTKLILQPIAENAIIHGVVPARRFCTISIKAYPLNDDIFFEISDNGVGVEPNLLAKLQEQLSDTSIHSVSGIGLDNVNQRIKIIYGNSYGCSISSDNGLTTVTVKIPKKS